MNIALSYENLLKKYFSFGVDVLFTQKGFYTPVVFTDINGNPTGEGYSILDRYNYVALPVKVGWRFGHEFYGFGNVGIAPGMISYADRKIPSYRVGNIIYEGEQLVLTDIVRRIDVAGLVELGGGYHISEELRVFGIAGFQHSFTPFSTPFYFNPANLWHYGFNFSVGAKYRLPAKKEELTQSQN